jgi:hypothetical protein
MVAEFTEFTKVQQRSLMPFVDLESIKANMLPLETKQSGGKLLPQSDLRGGGGGFFLDEVSRRRKRKRDILVGAWKMDLQEVGRCCGDWMELAQDRDRWRALLNTVMNFPVQ